MAIRLMVVTFFLASCTVLADINNVTGRYQAQSGTAPVIITYDNDREGYCHTLHDITMCVENFHNRNTAVCLVFIDFSILIPRTMVVGEKASCPGAAVHVKDFHPRFMLGDQVYPELYELHVEGFEWMEFEDGRRFRRRPGEYTLYYSVQDGLLGFTFADSLFLRQEGL